ncbi:TonB-dependent Receptor Plug Domain [Cyclobacterium xiamenense]|uniref:TonB-dependent Receptor Plug Domain n=1 Tax=Cyclobacterium xiamenense TaxID=1297121 RepID=A0A1H6VKZ8_9BACT|nr:outer membrane beta-barrel protein [Cyclobacterium xiamenense]SEJ04346.1 TonB-dependent Receptor Plug Domain [Cyclobacterium xiamenense]
MNFTRYIFTTAFFFLLGLSHLAAQEQSAAVTGSVRDEADASVPFANVLLLEAATGDLVTGAVTDEAGNFLLTTPYPQELILGISSIGFESFRSQPFRLNPGTKKDFGSLRLESEMAGLDEVTVNAARPNVLIQADKTVVTVEGTVMAEGNNALDVIGRSPGVFVDADGNIQLNGRTGLIVLIDDRQTYMSAADLANFLRAMPADNIRSIEVIQNPPAKYDAEGAAGVINLVLKKNNFNGTNGNVHAGSQFNGLHTPSAGATLNIKQNKWTSNASLNYNQWGRFTDLEILRRFQLENGLSAFDQNARLKLLRNNLFFSGGTEYQINDRHSLGINLQASGQKGAEDGNSLTAISNPDNTDLNYLNALNDSESDNARIFGNFHYTGKLDTLGTKISADIDYTRMDAGSLSMLDNRYWQNENTSQGSSDRIRTGNEMDYSIFTAKVDFTKPLGAEKELETGLKGSWVRSDNLLDISKSTEEGPFVPDPNSNHFIYRENVLAAYVSYKTPLTEKLALQAGLRAEYAAIEGNSVTRSEINTQEYLDLFPSAYLQQQVSDDYQIVYNVNRRITRPYYRQLNPFVFYIDPLTTEEGNPDLQPQYANNLEMNHILKNAYQFSLSFSQTENAFGQIMVQDEENRKTSIQMQNLDRTQNLSLRAVVPVEFAEWYSSSNMLQLNGNTFQSQLGEELLDEKQFSFMVRSQHNVLLPKGFKLELVGIYRSPFRDGQLVINGMSWVDAGITKTFYEDKLSLTVNGSDIFRTMKFKGNIDFDRINTDVQQYNSMQSVRFTLRWKFAQGEQFKVSQRSGSTEERNRLE